MRRLQQALREKERDLERLRCILSNNEETITVLSVSLQLFVIFNGACFSELFAPVSVTEPGRFGER